MANCPYCSFQINESLEIKFCIECERQVKCLECGYILFKNKSRCLSCGSSFQELQSNSIPLNTFSLQEEQSEKGYSRNINLSFTNETASTVASVVGGYVPFSAPTSRQQAVTIEPQQQPMLPPFQVSEEIVEDTPELQDNIEKETQDYSDINTATNYFEKDEEGFLVSHTRDYKGKNKKLQQQRFSLLYVWGYESLLGEPVSKEHLKKAARINGIYDKNYTGHLTDTSNRFLITVNSTFKLNPAGREEVKNILGEIQNLD